MSRIYVLYAKTCNSLFFSETDYLDRRPMVYVIIPVHNRIDATLDCLSCLEKQTCRDLKILVIDDGSTDGTYEKVKEKYPDVEVLKGDGTLWWTGAMHMGVEHVIKRAEDDDFVLSLNNDTAFEPDFVESLLKISFRHGGNALVGSMEKDYFQRGKTLYAGAWLDWKTFRFDVKRELDERDKSRTSNEHVNVLPGRGLLIPVSVFKRIGNFNKKMCPHYIADYEFTMRAFNAGIKLVLSYESVIYSRTDLTGISIKDMDGTLTFREALRQFFSRKSDNNIVDFINFVRLQCPNRYKYWNVLKIIGGAFFRLKAMRPIRQLIILLLPKKVHDRLR